MEFYRFDRWDGYIGPITGIAAATHYQEAGGENSLTLTTATEALNKGDRVVWRDGLGKWHEHVANEPSATRDDDGGVVYETYCEDALNEVFRDKVDDVRVRSGTAYDALGRVLQQTRWERGKVDVTETRTKSFYHISAGEALQDLVEAWGGEIYSSFEANDNGITKRMVNLVNAMGSRETHRRFEYGKDLVSVKRTVDASDVYTAMRGFGKGDDLGDEDDSTNGRRITFAEINGGKDYVEDLDALARWGRPDGKGGKSHAFGTVTFSDCEKPEELLELTRAELDASKEPMVSYECSVQDLEALGRSWEGVAVGDDVQVVDTAFDPALRLEARVMALKRDLLEAGNDEITIGNVRNTIGGELSAIVSEIAGIGQQSSSWDAAVNLRPNYLDRVIATLNASFDSGGAYKYESFEQGIVVSSVPLDDQMRPKQTPASAIQLKGGGFRIAAAVKADGSFDWRTFGTGNGFTADLITAGAITSADGSFRLNLDTGEFVLSPGATVNGDSVATGGSVSSAVSKVESELVGRVDGVAESVGDVSDRVSNIEAYVRIEVNSAGEPVLMLGDSASDLMAMLTNKELGFYDAGVRVAYIGGKKLMIENAEIKQNLEFGNWSWFARTGGNMALKWIG